MATSAGVEGRPSGTVDTKPARFCSVSGFPKNRCVLAEDVAAVTPTLLARRAVTHIPVLPTTGDTALNRICFGPYSTAMVLEAMVTAAFDALYHVSPGRGRMPAVDAICMKHPGRLFSRK